MGLCQNVAAWLTGAPQGCVSGPLSFFSLYTKWVKSSPTNHIIKSSDSILVPAKNEKWYFLTAAEQFEGLKRKNKTKQKLSQMTVLPVLASRGACTSRHHCALCIMLSVICVFEMERQGHGGPVDLHRQWSKVVSSIYCRLRRSDSHPECNLTPRRSDLHGLRVRFKSFNYSAVRWHFKFGLSFVLFAVTFLSFLSFSLPPPEAPSVAPLQRNFDERRVVVFSFPGLWKCLSECCWWKNDSVKINICAFAFLVNKCNSSSTEANLSEMLASVCVFFDSFLTVQR